MKEVRLKDICKKGSSQLKQKDVEKLSGPYPVYGASGQIASMNSFHQDKDYIAIVKDGSGIGRVMFLPAKSSVIGTMQYILPKEGYDIRYIGYCLQSLGLSSYKQGAAIPHIYFRDYGKRIINVEEDIKKQAAIVSKLDTAFVKIDKIIANAADALNEAQDYFATSLCDSFVPKEEWLTASVDKLALDVKYGTSKPSHADGDYIYLRMNNISNDGHLVLKDLKYISLPEKELEKCIVRKGDILFNRTNSYEHVGKTCVFNNETPMVIAGYIIRVRLNDNIIPEFFSYFMNSACTKQVLRGLSVGAVHQSNISAKSLKKVNVFFPESIAEQRKIVESIQQQELKIKSLKENYDKIVSECMAMKQALLKEVFGD